MDKTAEGASWRFAATVVLVLSVALLSCAGKQTPRDQITDPGELIFNGLAVSGVDCYKCHGGDGTGTWRGANLVKMVPTMSEEAITKTINEGPGMMPAFKGKLTPEEMASLTKWLHGRFR